MRKESYILAYIRRVGCQYDKVEKKVKNFLKKRILSSPLHFFFHCVLLTLLVPFILILLMKGIDGCSFGWFRMDDAAGFDTWFGFWGSYLGVMATTALGVITIYLTLKIDRNNEEQNRISMASEFLNLRIDNCVLYDMEEDFFPKVLDKMDTFGRYVFKIHVPEVFSPYFKLSLRQIYWENKSRSDSFSVSCRLNENKDYVIEDNGDLSIYFSLSSKMLDRKTLRDIHYFYHINLFEPRGILPSDRYRYLELEMAIKNKMITDRENDGHSRQWGNEEEDDLFLRLRLQLENVGREKLRGEKIRSEGMELAVRKRSLNVLGKITDRGVSGGTISGPVIE